MSFQDTINNSVNNRSFINNIVDTLSYIYDFLYILYNKCYNFMNNKGNINMKKDIHKDIYLFLNDITNKWNNNTIDIELGSDVIYLFNKYSMETKKDINIQDDDMKCYMLGWYIYKTMNNNKSVTNQ